MIGPRDWILILNRTIINTWVTRQQQDLDGFGFHVILFIKFTLYFNMDRVYKLYRLVVNTTKNCPSVFCMQAGWRATLSCYEHCVLYDQTNFGTVKHNCWLLGHRVSRNTRETRCCTHAWCLRIYNTPVGPVTSTCVSQCRTIMCQIIVTSMCLPVFTYFQRITRCSYHPRSQGRIHTKNKKVLLFWLYLYKGWETKSTSTFCSHLQVDPA